MITDKKSYQRYLKSDLQAYNFVKITPYIYFRVDCLRYLRRLRKIEYIFNTKQRNPFYKILLICLEFINHRLAVRIGLTIPKNVFDEGLCIVHHGTIVVSHLARVGKNCRIHPSTCIGEFNGAPVIGDNVYIGPGAKIYGNISIGNNVAIGANAVVNKNIPDNVTIGGVPARIISHKSSIECNVYPENFITKEK